MVLEPVLLRQDFIRKVVQAILVIHKAGQWTGKVNTHYFFIGSWSWGISKPVGIPDALFHEGSSSKRVDCAGFNPRGNLSCKPVPLNYLKLYKKKSTSEHKSTKQTPEDYRSWRHSSNHQLSHDRHFYSS